MKTNKHNTILIVDDTPSVIDLIKSVLTEVGYDIIIATSGTKAIERINYKKPDLILLDIVMPGIDGFETCKKIKTNKKTSDIPVIFLSALNKSFNKVKAFNCGAVDYITKPINNDELLARVNTQLKIHLLQKQLVDANNSLELKIKERTKDLEKANKTLSITNKKLHTTYKALTVSEEKFSKAFFSTPAIIGISTYNTGKYIEVNQSFTKILGYSSKETIGKSSTELNLWINPEKRNKIIKLLLEFKYIHNIELLLRHKKGHIITLLWSAEIIEINNEKCILATGIDITERKKSTLALIESEERFRKLSDLTFEGIVLHKKGKVIDVNNSMIKLTGYGFEELIGKKLIKLLVPEKYHSIVKNNIEQEYSLPFETEIRRSDGFYVPVELVSVTIKYHNEKIRVTSARDITEKREYEKRVLNAILEAEESERERFSRELHDGLGPILSTLNMYFQWLSDTDDKEKIEIILSNGRECINEAINTVEEISNNITPRTLNSFGLKAALKTFISRSNNVNEINMDFHCNFEERLEPNTEAAIYRIITELINNTLKYAEADTIRISIILDDVTGKLQVNYSDNGIGFNFDEVSKSKKGLGLINIQQRIKILGTYPEYITEPGKGVSVFFECNVKTYEDANK